VSGMYLVQQRGEGDEGDEGGVWCLRKTMASVIAWKQKKRKK
jgi:hypothetical protein